MGRQKENKVHSAGRCTGRRQRVPSVASTILSYLPYTIAPWNVRAFRCKQRSTPVPPTIYVRFCCFPAICSQRCRSYKHTLPSDARYEHNKNRYSFCSQCHLPRPRPPLRNEMVLYRDWDTISNSNLNEKSSLGDLTNSARRVKNCKRCPISLVHTPPSTETSLMPK